MKKRIESFFAICMTILLLIAMMSCASNDFNTPGGEAILKKAESLGYDGDSGMIENATPENSVLVYGWSIEPYVYLYYVDENSDWQTIQKVGGEFFLPPAPKGANLKVKASKYIYTVSSGAGNVVYTRHEDYEVRNNEWNVKVPKDKPLYFMGIHSIVNLNVYSWKTINEMRNELGNVMIGYPKTEDEYDDWYKKTYTNTEKACLKKLLKKYKGTAWEPLIKERMDELSK